MKRTISIFIAVFSLSAMAAPTPFPVFLKIGFSSILEFEEIPVRVVLGDSQNFQVEKMDHSLAVKTLTPYATTNMFVYFKTLEPKLFILTASEDAVPTYYKKFETPKPPLTVVSIKKPAIEIFTRNIRLTSAHFDKEKDYLTVEIEISSNSQAALKPHWEWVRLVSGVNAITPVKLWSERRDVQKDSRVKARFIFVKPNVSRNLKATKLVIPILGSEASLSINLEGRVR